MTKSKSKVWPLSARDASFERSTGETPVRTQSKPLRTAEAAVPPLLPYHGWMPLPERELIARIRKMSGKKTLIGDDCAVLDPPAGHELLVTTDLCLEGVHFRRDWHPADSVGHRCLARGLSDIA